MVIAVEQTVFDRGAMNGKNRIDNVVDYQINPTVLS